MSVSAAENAGPGPGELQDPLWVKMNAITSGITKKRKKSDAKPQSQINKCLNEKKRRTQENLYIDELAELISATDMSSGKTDKCQILQRTVDQIQHIRQQEGNNSHAVQQGEVSSSNPNILSSDQVGPILLEALDGFLFVVNTEGRVEYVTDNIQLYINYTKDDVLGKDIYNIIHHGDHQSFMPSCVPTSIDWMSGTHPQSRNRTFICRFLVKPPNDKDETMEEKQQRVSKYESMQVCSALLSTTSNRSESGDVTSESSDIGPCVMCVARRIPINEQPVNTIPIQQFTVKLDTTGRIAAVDTSNLTILDCQYLSKELVGTTIQDLCHPHDLSILTAHLKDTLQVGEGTTPLYRLRISPDKFVNVQTNSRFFKGNVMNGHCADFIMSNHSIIWDNDLTPSEGGQLSNSKVCSGHSSNHCANNISNNNGNNNNNVSGQLMSVAHVTGQVSGIVGRTLTTTTNPSDIPYGTSDTLSHQINSQTTSNPFNHFSTNVDLEYELFPNSSWDLDSNSGCGGDTPESRNNPTSNSRPPSQPAPNAASSPQAPYTSNSTVTSHCSPLRAYSPTSMIGAHSFSNSFPFSPLQDSQQSLISGAGVINGGSSSSGAGTSGGSIGKDARGCPTPNHSGIESIGTIGASSSTTTSISTATTTTSVSASSSTSSAVAAATSTISTSGTSTSSSSLSGTITATAAATTATSSSSITPASLSVAPTTNLLTTAESQSNNLSTTGDSGRLRNLLTKGVNANSCDDTQDSASGGGSSSNNDTENQNDHRILKILLNQQDEDDYHSEHSGKVRPNPNTIPKSASDHNKSSLGNNMLLQLLNEKNDDDDDTRAGLKKQNELLQQLLKDPDEERKMQEQKNRDDDSLLRSLGFRSSTPPSSQSGDHVHGGSSQSGQKRPGEDGDINMAVKRPMDGTHQVSSSGSSTTSQTPSKLWERNKMLASLLAKEPSQPTIIPPIPASVISATPQDKMPRVAERMKQQQQQPWNISGMQSVGSTATTSVATSARTPLQNQSRQLPRQPTNIYLSQIQRHDRPQMSQMDSEFAGGGEFRTPAAESNTWDNQSSDPDLSDILDQVIDFVPDEVITDSSTIANLLDVIEAPQNNPMNEKMAINAIQKSLMLCENAVNSTSSTMTMPTTPPAYSTAMISGTPVTTTHNYQPPPMYQQQTRARFAGQAGIRQTAAPFTQQQQQQQQQLQLQLQRNKLLQQQQLKQRLLQQQQQQQLLIPSNATAPDQISGIHNIDNLMNNTVAPNVSLQRSSVSDSQISPGYGGSVQLSTNHRLSHSYSHPSTINQHPAVNNNFNSGQQVSATARLSPHSPAGMLSFSHPQPLSPRVSQGNYVNNPRMFNVNQTRAQQQQQQQPATQQQLQQQQQQQQRSMPSPGSAVSARQSPYPAEVFPPPASPTASQFPPVPNPGNSNPTAQYRLQRASSTPTATTQLPGGIGSPRHYGGVTKDQQQTLLSPSHPRGGCQTTPTHNQHNATNQNQHFTNQQHASMLYRQTVNNASNHDVQKNQFCYEQGSVSVYSSGPEDPRSMSSSNPVNHQMGGNTSGPGSMTSEFVRQELRAVVGARTQQRVPNNIQNNLIGQVSQDELEALGLSFEMSPAGETVASDGPAKSWAIGSAGSAPSSSRSTMEEVVRGDSKSSLLQKLLSE